MYKSGELDKVMAEFEKTLKVVPVYVSGSRNMDRADKYEVDIGEGRTSMRYMRNCYYNNGQINQLFVLYLHGYSSGKHEGRFN